MSERRENTYDANGNVISEETFIGTTDKLYAQKLFAYDNYGNLVKEELYEEDQTEAYSTIIYSYTAGLCTKMVEYRRGIEPPAFINEYVYEFYED